MVVTSLSVVARWVLPGGSVLSVVARSLSVVVPSLFVSACFLPVVALRL